VGSVVLSYTFYRIETGKDKQPAGGLEQITMESESIDPVSPLRINLIN
jgi:hypothetical protein